MGVGRRESTDTWSEIYDKSVKNVELDAAMA